MKRGLVATLILLAIITSASIYEWRYSEDMQEHITSVNRDLEDARLEETYSRDLVGSLRAMTAAADVAQKIIITHEFVHTLKDEVLAWKVKKAVEQSATVGGAIQNVLAKWPESL